jgi:hypothetical protein
MWSTQRERLHHGGPLSLEGNSVPRDGSELRPRTRISRKYRERSRLCVWGLTERGPWGKIGQWWMAIGGALGQRKFPVNCERVAFSRIGGSGKAAQILEQGQCRGRTWSKSWHQNVRKNAAHKESSWEKSHVQEQGLMIASSFQAG